MEKVNSQYSIFSSIGKNQRVTAPSSGEDINGNANCDALLGSNLDLH